MKREQILATIKMLAKSQGLYGRILRAMEECKAEFPDVYEQNMQFLEEQNFKSELDLIYYFEC